MSNSNEPILQETVEGSKRLFCMFGGIAGHIAMPPFEFYRSSKIINENKLFFRDCSQSWYQNGLPPVGTNADSIAAYIKDAIQQMDVEETVFVGSSMGGFAAILFSKLIGFPNSRVIAFAPQTFISPLKRLRSRDWRWSRQISNMYYTTLFKRTYLDMQSMLERTPSENPIIHIYSSGRDPLDLVHARRVAHCRNVKLHISEDGDHGLVKSLRDCGELPGILLDDRHPF